MPPRKRSGPATTPGRSTSQVLARTADRANIRQTGDPVPLSQAIGEFLGLTQAREKWWERVAAAEWRAGYDAGRADGEEAGYLRAVREIKRVHRNLRDALAAELRRWPPSGRGAFGKPRPGDFPGRGAA